MLTGKLYVICAPSGAGKTSLVRALAACTRHVQVSTSHTTRPHRPEERPGVSYHFVEEEKFLQMRDQGLFLEHAYVYGHYYGTSRTWVEEKIAAGEDVVLEIDWQGAQQVRLSFPECITIFILPPSTQALKERLIGRAQDSDIVIENRLSHAIEDMKHYNEFDYIVINDEFDLALRDLQTIIRSRRLTTAWVKTYKKSIIEKLFIDT